MLAAHSVESIQFGPFSPADPRPLPGWFAETIAVAPMLIHAPLATVWEVLVDFARYPEWNPLNRSFRLETDSTPGSWVSFEYTLKGPHSDGRLRDADHTMREVLTVWEPECCLSYADIRFGYKNERTQFIQSVGDSTTSYLTYERFSGVLSPLIRRIYGAQIRSAFTNVGIALKERAERRTGG